MSFAPLECCSGLTGVLSMAVSAAMIVRLEGKGASGSNSEPSKTAGANGKPQSFSKGGPELSGAKGTSTSRIFSPGKLGLNDKIESKARF